MPFAELYRVMRGFLSDLERAEKEQRIEVEAIRMNLGVDATYHDTPVVERYSLAVQFFGALSVEAAISFYAILRFGGESYDEVFGEVKVINRLKLLLRLLGCDADRRKELVDIVAELMAARNRIAHPTAAEFLPVGSEKKPLPKRVMPDASAAAARKAVKLVDQFFDRLRATDPDHAHFLLP